jgi:hypothetical protein
VVWIASGLRRLPFAALNEPALVEEAQP